MLACSNEEFQLVALLLHIILVNISSCPPGWALPSCRLHNRRNECSMLVEPKSTPAHRQQVWRRYYRIPVGPRAPLSQSDSVWVRSPLSSEFIAIGCISFARWSRKTFLQKFETQTKDVILTVFILWNCAEEEIVLNSFGIWSGPCLYCECVVVTGVAFQGRRRSLRTRHGGQVNR